MSGETRNQTPQEERAGREAAKRLASGEITVAEYAGLRREQLYEIAQVGYRLLNSGKLEQAREIYQGLVAADPFDSVFHCHLAALHLRAGETDEALKSFTAALNFNKANVDALAGRGEAYLNLGQIAEAIKDLSAATEFDPEARRPSTARARAMLLALKEADNQRPAPTK
jgi:tetratricopeptide (TPR) repeat protein